MVVAIDDKGVYFRKDSEGNDLFYPWMFPGEALYVSSTQQNKICIAFIVLAGAFIVSCFVPVILHITEYLDSNEMNITWAISQVFLSLCFMTGLVIIRRNKIIYAEPAGQRLPKKMTFLIWIVLCIPQFQVIDLLISQNMEVHSIFLLGICVCYLIVVSMVLLRVKQTKGYLFSNFFNFKLS